MSNINSWNTREPAILSVLFPILFIMSEEETPVAPAVEEPCTGESCTPEVEETTTEATPEVAPTETEATPA